MTNYALLTIYELPSNPGPFFLAEDCSDFTRNLGEALLFESREGALARRAALPNGYQFAVAAVEHDGDGRVEEYEVTDHPDDEEW